MIPPATPETLYWGLKLYEFLTLIGIIIGPIAAVIITLATESRGQKRERRIQVMRMLLNTRNMPGDAAYSVAINLIPVEFNKMKKVMRAWTDYIEAVRFRPTKENKEGHNVLLKAKQTALIFQIMQSLGFDLSETDIQTSAYISEGYIHRDNMYLDSLQAMCDIANEIKTQNKFLRGVLAANASTKSEQII
jgi:hypothetical protein